jgi:hypothetical protein
MPQDSVSSVAKQARPYPALLTRRYRVQPGTCKPRHCVWQATPVMLINRTGTKELA